MSNPQWTDRGAWHPRQRMVRGSFGDDDETVEIAATEGVAVAGEDDTEGEDASAGDEDD